jgi:hypothetical protein
MLQQPPSPALADDDYPTEIDAQPHSEAEVGLKWADCADILAEIDRLEETILASPRVPLTGKTVVNEEELLDRLDLIRSSLPETLKTAQEILAYKYQIIKTAQQQANELIAEAHRQAYLIVNELGIIDRVEAEASQVRQNTIAECEQLRQQAASEVERVRNYNVRELEQMRQVVKGECEQIQTGADEYADRVLSEMESQLADVLKVIQRGREHLTGESASVRNSQLPFTNLNGVIMPIGGAAPLANRA